MSGTFIDLYSGLGGIAMALKRAHMQDVALVDENAQKLSFILDNNEHFNVVDRSTDFIISKNFKTLQFFDDLDVLSANMGKDCYSYRNIKNNTGSGKKLNNAFEFASYYKPKLVMLVFQTFSIQEKDGEASDLIKKTFDSIGYDCRVKDYFAYQFHSPHMTKYSAFVFTQKNYNGLVDFEFPEIMSKNTTLGYTYEHFLTRCNPRRIKSIDYIYSNKRNRLARENGFCNTFSKEHTLPSLPCSPSRNMFSPSQYRLMQRRSFNLHEYLDIQCFPMDYKIDHPKGFHYCKYVAREIPFLFSCALALRASEYVEKIKSL